MIICRLDMTPESRRVPRNTAPVTTDTSQSGSNQEGVIAGLRSFDEVDEDLGEQFGGKAADRRQSGTSNFELM